MTSMCYSKNLNAGARTSDAMHNVEYPQAPVNGEISPYDLKHPLVLLLLDLDRVRERKVQRHGHGNQEHCN